MLRFVLDHLKTNKTYKNIVKKFLFVIWYDFDWYKTQERYCKVILENDGTLVFLPDFYKSQKLCKKAVDNYAHALEFVASCYET